jgi:predicted transcriptional regulator
MGVDFELNDVDLEIALLGEAGWHAHAIAEEVRLTKSQVHYRLGLAGVKLKNYRNGKSEMSKFVVSMIKARHSAKERVTEVRQIPETFGNLQQQYAESCSSKRKPKKGAQAKT